MQIHDPGAPAVAGCVAIIAAGTTVGATKSSPTGPILAVVGALLVALITAYTAYRRQRADLAAQRERIGEQLAAEHDRLTAQLGHERALTDLAQLRSLIDEGATLLDEMRLRLEQAAGQTPQDEGYRSRSPRIVRKDLRAYSLRLATRIGAHRVQTSYLMAIDRALTISNLRQESADQDRIAASQEEFTRTTGEWLVAAQDLVGVRGDDGQLLGRLVPVVPDA
jgi:hypothetical protein